MIAHEKDIIKIRYPINFTMEYEDSEIPIIGRAVMIEQKPQIINGGAGLIVVLDARLKKYLFLAQRRIEILELWGWLSLQGKPGGTQYYVFHMCNSKLLDFVDRASK